jgi:hypothetical protein
MKDLHVRPEDLKPLEENIGKTAEDTGICNEFLNKTLVVPTIRASTDKRGCVKLRSFCTSKETITRIDSLQNGGKSLYS